MSRRQALFLLFLVITCCLVLAFLFRVKGEMVDFEVNYTAARRIRLGETLYRTADGHYQFKYLPFSAFLYLPLSLLSLDLAKAVWYGVVLASSFLIFFLSLRLIRQEEKKNLQVILVPALILARYFLRELQLGQINAFITFLLLATIVLLSDPDTSRRRELAAGLIHGVATALKPYAIILGPYFVLRKKWLSLAGSLFALLVGLTAPALFYGFKGNWLVLREWLSSLSTSTPKLFSSQDNVSLMGFLVKWTGRPGLSFILYLFIALGIGLLCLLLIARGKAVVQPMVLEGFLLLSLVPLLSPLGWDYTFLSAAPAVMMLVRFFDRFPTFWRVLLGLDFALIGLTFYDLLGRDAYAAFMSWSVTTVCFLMLVGYLSFLRIRALA